MGIGESRADGGGTILDATRACPWKRVSFLTMESRSLFLPVQAYVGDLRKPALFAGYGSHPLPSACGNRPLPSACGSYSPPPACGSSPPSPPRGCQLPSPAFGCQFPSPACGRRWREAPDEGELVQSTAPAALRAPFPASGGRDSRRRAGDREAAQSGEGGAVVSCRVRFLAAGLPLRR